MSKEVDYTQTEDAYEIVKLIWTLPGMSDKSRKRLSDALSKGIKAEVKAQVERDCAEVCDFCEPGRTDVTTAQWDGWGWRHLIIDGGMGAHHTCLATFVRLGASKVHP